jgi:hypothetical protein
MSSIPASGVVVPGVVVPGVGVLPAAANTGFSETIISPPKSISIASLPSSPKVCREMTNFVKLSQKNPKYSNINFFTDLPQIQKSSTDEEKSVKKGGKKMSKGRFKNKKIIKKRTTKKHKSNRSSRRLHGNP